MIFDMEVVTQTSFWLSVITNFARNNPLHISVMGFHLSDIYFTGFGLIWKPSILAFRNFGNITTSHDHMYTVESVLTLKLVWT